MKKTSVFAALIAAFALTACGDNPAPAAASDASAASAASAPAASAPAASDAASAPAAAASGASLGKTKSKNTWPA